jgi:hypothetical protein
MARRIATVAGYALRPGVSRNGRLYTADMIAGAVERAQPSLATGIHLVDRTARVLDQRTHHAAEDDSTRIVGRLTKLTLEDDGSARFEADLADTPHGRTIASLIAPKGDGPDEVEPFLTGVSIRGAWRGKVRREQHDGRLVDTADGLDIDGLDYTGRPGVDGAVIDGVDFAGHRPPGESEDDSGRVLIYESVQEAQVTAVITEADASTKGPSGDVPYADHGYLRDKQRRYPLDTKAAAKAAWCTVNEADTARSYTSAQLKRVKQRIGKALRSYGVTIAVQERWLIDQAAPVTGTLAECWDMEAGAEGSLYLSLTNGPTTVTVSSRVLDPHDLDIVGRAAMAGACDALAGLDPDMDGDIDLPGAEPEDDDGDASGLAATEPGSACSCGCGCAVPHPMAVADGCPCGCGCNVCHAQSGPAEDAEESAPLVVAGDQPTAEHWQALHAAGMLQPGTVVTAAMVNEAMSLQRQPNAAATPQTPAETAAETTTSSEEAPVTESTTPAATTPGTPENSVADLSAKFDKLTDLIGGLVSAMAPKPAEAAPAAPVVEQAPSAPALVAETEEERIARLVAEGVRAALPLAVQETVERYGPPTRKGLVRPVAETTAPAAGGGTGVYGLPEGWPDKPLHTYTKEERARYMEPIVVQTFLGDRADRG